MSRVKKRSQITLNNNIYFYPSRESRNAHKSRCPAAAQPMRSLKGDSESQPAERDRGDTAAKEEAAEQEEKEASSTPPPPPPPPRVVCETCRRPFANAKNLRDHMNIVHADHESLLGVKEFGLIKYRQVSYVMSLWSFYI